MKGKRMFSSNFTPLIHSSIPYQVLRGGPSVEVGQRKGRAGRVEPRGRNKRREGSLVGLRKGRRRGTLKFTVLIFFQEMALTHKRHEWRGSGGISGPLRKGKRKRGKGPVVLRSLQVSVLQAEPQDAGGMKGKTWNQQSRRGEEVTRGIQSPSTVLSSCPDVSRIWVLG